MSDATNRMPLISTGPGRRWVLWGATSAGIVLVVILSAVFLRTADKGVDDLIAGDAARLVLTLRESDLPIVGYELRDMLDDPRSGQQRILVIGRTTDGASLDPVYPADVNPALIARLREQPRGSSATIRLPDGLARVKVVNLNATPDLNPGAYSDIELYVGRYLPTPGMRSAFLLVVVTIAGFTLAATMLLRADRKLEHDYRERLAGINAHLLQVGRGDFKPLPPQRPGAPSEVADLAVHVTRMIRDLTTWFDGYAVFSRLAIHSLGTPLTRMSLRMDALAKVLPGDTPEAVITRLQEIDEEIQYLGRLQKSVSHLARAHTLGLDPTTARVVDLSVLLKRISSRTFGIADDVDVYSTVNSGNPVRVIRCIEDGISVFGDEMMIDQLFSNLIENAVKYAQPGATITIAARVEGDNFIAGIANTGSGFPTEIRVHAFAAFERSVDAKNRKGFGLGLNLVKVIAHKHGWEADIAPGTSVAEVTVRGPLATGHSLSSMIG